MRWWVPFLRVAAEIAFLEPYTTAPLPAPSAAALPAWNKKTTEYSLVELVVVVSTAYHG